MLCVGDLVKFLFDPEGVVITQHLRRRHHRIKGSQHTVARGFARWAEAIQHCHQWLLLIVLVIVVVWMDSFRSNNDPKVIGLKHSPRCWNAPGSSYRELSVHAWAPHLWDQITCLMLSCNTAYPLRIARRRHHRYPCICPIPAVSACTKMCNFSKLVCIFLSFGTFSGKSQYWQLLCLRPNRDRISLLFKPIPKHSLTNSSTLDMLQAGGRRSHAQFTAWSQNCLTPTLYSECWVFPQIAKWNLPPRTIIFPHPRPYTSPH